MRNVYHFSSLVFPRDVVVFIAIPSSQLMVLSLFPCSPQVVVYQCIRVDYSCMADTTAHQHTHNYSLRHSLNINTYTVLFTRELATLLNVTYIHCIWQWLNSRPQRRVFKSSWFKCTRLELEWHKWCQKWSISGIVRVIEVVAEW